MCVTCFCVLVSLSELLSIIKKEKKNVGTTEKHTHTHINHTQFIQQKHKKIHKTQRADESRGILIIQVKLENVSLAMHINCFYLVCVFVHVFS